MSAGYAQDEELRLIFVGQVETVDTVKQGKDLVTTLRCKDGQTPTNSVRVSKSFPRTNTYGDVIDYLVGVYAENGVATGEVVTSYSTLPQGFQSVASLPQDYPNLLAVRYSPSKAPLVSGYSVTGYLHQALEKICKQLGYVNYITNGKIHVHPKNWTKTVEQYEFNSTQMKSIRPLASTATNSALSKGVDGIRVTTFLDGRLDIDKRIKILDGKYAGEYKIVTKHHTLNYESGGWDTTITCNKIKAD